MKVDLRHAMDIGPEDHLPNGKVKLSAALLKIAGTVAVATGVRDAATFGHVMKIAGIGWNLAVLQQFPDLHPNASATLPTLLDELPAEARGLVEISARRRSASSPGTSAW
jgi:hypothetical protein